jgi:hypothetical protein
VEAIREKAAHSARSTSGGWRSVKRVKG